MMIRKNIYTNIIPWAIFLCVIQTFMVYAPPAVTVKEVKNVNDIEINKKPLVVEFYRPSCPHCQVMAPRYEQAAQEDRKGISCYKVNVDNMGLTQDIAQKLSTNTRKIQINGVPTFIFLDHNGNSSEMVGQMELGALKNKMSKL
jgi:thiol-disulfide isomerase/thioredoxin